VTETNGDVLEIDVGGEGGGAEDGGMGEGEDVKGGEDGGEIVFAVAPVVRF